MIGETLLASLRAERAGKLDDALAIVSGEAHPVLAVVASRLALAIRGPESALALVPDGGAWSVRAAAALARAAAHLRIHTAPALDQARLFVGDAQAILSGAPDDPAAIDPDTAAAIAGAGDAGRFLLRGSLGSHALELAALAAARGGDPRGALEGFEAAYAAGEGDPDRRARVLLAWGLQLRNWGLLDEAVRRIERSLELRLELDDLHGAAMCQGVLAFVHQRRGDHLRERDALVADLRLCERIGTVADLPGLRARLAGALVGLGKYAAAWSEAEAALDGPSAGGRGDASPEGELGASPAIRTSEVRPASAGANHDPRARAFARREQARVRLAESRHDDADVLIDQAISEFHGLGDAYGAALCELTRAQIELARGDAAGAIAARDRAAPVFARLGAIAEAAELTLIACEAEGGDAAAARILSRVLPALIEAGFAATPLATRARELAARLSPAAVRADLVERAAKLPALAAKVLE